MISVLSESRIRNKLISVNTDVFFMSNQHQLVTISSKDKQKQQIQSLIQDDLFNHMCLQKIDIFILLSSGI